jgi:hypothetical protein
VPTRADGGNEAIPGCGTKPCVAPDRTHVSFGSKPIPTAGGPWWPAQSVACKGKDATPGARYALPRLARPSSGTGRGWGRSHRRRRNKANRGDGTNPIPTTDRSQSRRRIEPITGADRSHSRVRVERIPNRPINRPSTGGSGPYQLRWKTVCSTFRATHRLDETGGLSSLRGRKPIASAATQW